MNNVVMYDRETDTLWSQFLAEAVEGPLTGTKLTLVASQLTTWGAWKARHPKTLVLDPGADVGISDRYQAYYLNNQAGDLGEANPDPRLFLKELVIGIVGEVSKKAYAYRDLTRLSVVNDTFEGRDLVVALDVNSDLAAVYSRSLGEETLTFAPADDSRLLTDRETGSTWDKASGTAVSGQLKGEQLEEITFFISFWFAWTDFYPGTELFEP